MSTDKRDIEARTPFLDAPSREAVMDKLETAMDEAHRKVENGRCATRRTNALDSHG